MRIYLIGYMGSGKSSMGKKLAARMEYSYIDLDEEIETDQKQSISQVFSEKGEEVFRILERIALHQTFGKENIVVSTGGGTPVFFDNIQQMNDKGLCIYLKGDVDLLVSRVIRNQQQRPLIANLDQSDLQKFMKDQLAFRSPFYEKAKMHIEAKDLTPAILHKQVLSWIENQIKA